MRQIPDLGDSRQRAFCVHCGHQTGTRDHVPSRVLLDEPYPENLPTVPACAACNSGISSDEEYLACMLDCALTGGTGASTERRPKIARILRQRPSLAARIAAAMSSGTAPVFSVEHERVGRVILKLARGHVLFELNEPHPEEPAQMNFAPLLTFSARQAKEFETNPAEAIWPEVGSRSMQRIVEGDSPTGWIVVQPGRYRFLAAAGSPGVIVRMVLSEYLAAEITWE